MKTFLIRGVPAAVQHDGWWLNTATVPDRGTRQVGDGQTKRTGRGGMGRIALLVALIALGDMLIWQVIPGVSLALFGMVLILAALCVSGRRVRPQTQSLILGGGLLALLPLVETVNPLSCALAFLGVSVALALTAGLNFAELARGAVRLWPLGMRQTARDAAVLTKFDASENIGKMLGRMVMAWFMPLVLGLVFLALLLQANPVANKWLADFGRTDWRFPDLDRLLFWLVLLPVAWTALSLRTIREQLRATPTPPCMGPAPMGLINPDSVIRALFMFNLLFVVQTVLDLVYLYGGVGLPEGISYASYARRGAYPLVVTGLLAGGFALLTRPWVQGNAMLRVLLMVLVAQNVALVISALVRLDLYVDHYGLTRLRVAAAIWMGLTAAGLALIVWQVARRQDNLWLVLRGGVLTVVVLYLCAWVPFDGMIARHNLTELPQQRHYYLCRLGDTAKPVVAAYQQATGRTVCKASALLVRSPADWREWGWRNARARNSLEAVQSEARK